MNTSTKKRTSRNLVNDRLNKSNEKGTAKSQEKHGSILGTLLEMDEHYTRILAVCADKTSLFGYLRPLMVLLEFSCHGVPWFVVCTVLLLSVHLPWHVELLVNVLLGKTICFFGEHVFSSQSSFCWLNCVCALYMKFLQIDLQFCFRPHKME